MTFLNPQNDNSKGWRMFLLTFSQKMSINSNSSCSDPNNQKLHFANFLFGGFQFISVVISGLILIKLINIKELTMTFSFGRVCSNKQQLLANNYLSNVNWDH